MLRFVLFLRVPVLDSSIIVSWPCNCRTYLSVCCVFHSIKYQFFSPVPPPGCVRAPVAAVFNFQEGRKACVPYKLKCWCDCWKFLVEFVTLLGRNAC